MNRRAAKLARRTILFLLLGAVLNVAVAWICAWTSPALFTRYPEFRGSFADEDYVASLLAESGYSTSGATLARDKRVVGARIISVEPDGVVFEFCGLPQLSMRQNIWWSSQPKSIDGLQLGVAKTQYGTTVCSMPLRPIWPGFAINTIFYAAVLWLPFATIGVIRRRRRADRGRCIACGYDLRGRGSSNKLCPECGSTAPESS